MSISVVRTAFRQGVGKRVFELFMVAAILPMLITAVLAYSEFNRGLRQETSKALKNSAKEYGVEILTRLEQSAYKADELVRIVERKGITAVTDHDYLLDDFESVWVFGDVAPDQFANLSVDEERLEAVRGGAPRLVLTDSGQLVLLKAAGDYSFGSPILALHVSPTTVWGARENLPFNTEFCVFSTTGLPLYCTVPVEAGVHAALLADGDGTRGSLFGEWEHDGDMQFVALWQLFLRGAFGAESFDIVAVQPQSFAMKSGTDFRRIFIPAVVLIILLVGSLAMYFVARSLGPLQNLTIAARQVAAGNFESRVRVRTGDEFEALGDAFNNMADRLSRQIAALEAMSGIDRMILTGTKVDEVSEDVVRHLMELTRCESAAVIARDADAREAARMTSRNGDDIYHDRIELPDDVGNRWCQPRQVVLDDVDPREAPYLERFESFGNRFAVLIPVVLHEDLKGVLLLGFNRQFDMSRNSLQRCVDLAARFAVALASVEREEALYRQAHFDPLTSLPNRQLMKDRLSQYLATAKLDNHSGALLFLDLDRFKEINDVFGHSVGDVVLAQAAERIESEVRERDTVARLGGDEFVVILPNVRNERIVRATAERLLDRLGEAFSVREIDHYLSASIGIAMFPEDGATVETLLKNADAAMYRAKDAGRGRFEFFSKRLNAESRRKIGIERDLRSAFARGELDIVYQPQFDISSGEISGAEALLRWNHPEAGAISPDEFVPLAEDSELIVDIGAWVVDKTCEDLRGIFEKGFHPGPVSINVSARQLADKRFRQAVMKPIRRHSIHPGYMQLEVTETTVAQNRNIAIAILEELRAEGVRVAIDDFGTGYSSLSYLQQLPFDVIKIDKSFVERIGSSITSDNICRTIIKMAEQLGKKSIAEGVESEEQVTFLRTAGCDYAQGFFYSKPLPRAEFAEFVEKQDFHTRRRRALEIVK